MSLPATLRALVLLPLLAAAGCAPGYLLGVQPSRPHADLPTTQDYAETTADSVSVAVRFAAYEPQWLVFEVEYHNDSRRPVAIDPTAFAHVPSRPAEATPLAPAARIRRGQRVPAVAAAASRRIPCAALPTAPLPALDPQARAAALQDQADLEARKASRIDWLGLALVAVSVGADVAGAVNPHETRTQYQTRAALHDVAWGYNAISTANRAGHAFAAQGLAGQAAQLRDFSLPAGQLAPGQLARGYIYLPRFDDADQLRVLAPLGGQRVALDFAQVHQRR